jgi:ABC-type glycerol-3-phosphate transport system substrate-binding protein
MTPPFLSRVLARCARPCSLGVLALAGCGGSAPAPGAGFAPIDATQAVFWDRQTTETAELLRSLVAEFNAGRSGIPVAVERAGGYSEIFRKVSASIQARRLPAMAVSYESMTAEYAGSGAVAPLDALVQDPATGFSPEELEDFFPAVLASNRFEQFGGQLYSFPFAKSVLMLYYNKRVLAAAGIAAPPETWVEFVDQCRKIKAATGKQAHAVSVDCSTVNGLIFSMGGEVLGPEGTLYDRPEAVAVFELYETLAKEGLAFQITPGTFDDEVALVNDQVAFTLAHEFRPGERGAQHGRRGGSLGLEAHSAGGSRATGHGALRPERDLVQHDARATADRVGLREAFHLAGCGRALGGRDGLSARAEVCGEPPGAPGILEDLGGRPGGV